MSCVISSITIPNTVISIGSGAFNNCPYLSSVFFEATSSLQTLGQTVFQSTAITSIIIPNSVTSMGNSVFNNDVVLNSVTNSSPTLSLGSTVFDPTYNSSSNNFYSSSTTNPMYIYVQTNYSNVILSPPSCFNKGTLILTKTGYIPIENISIGDEILTMNQIYKKVIFMHKQPFDCSNFHFTNCMCKYKCDNFPDLIISGGHAIIVDELTEKMNDFIKENNYYDYVMNDKFKLLAGLDNNCEKIFNGIFTVYHIVLENNFKDKCYGIYANGILTETMSEKYYYYITGNKHLL